jgi:hypothetical protein
MTATARRIQIRIAATAIPLLLLTLVPLQQRIEVRTNFLQDETRDTLYATGAMLKKLSLGYDSLLADIYWTRTVQYYGRRVGHPDANYDLLAPLLDITTTLDPRLVVAYRFGGTFLAEGPPIGADRPDLGAKLLLRGIAANPDHWQLYSDLGTIYYWHMKNYKAAAQAFWRGGDAPGAPPWMKSFAAHVTEQGVSRDDSRFMWSEVYQSTTDARLRHNALGHLKVLQAQDEMDALTRIVANYKKQYGRVPASPVDLVSAGMMVGVAKDPEGFAYRIEPDGKAGLDPASPMNEMFETLAQK